MSIPDFLRAKLIILWLSFSNELDVLLSACDSGQIGNPQNGVGGTTGELCAPIVNLRGHLDIFRRTSGKMAEWILLVKLRKYQIFFFEKHTSMVKIHWEFVVLFSSCFNFFSKTTSVVMNKHKNMYNQLKMCFKWSIMLINL